MQLITDNSNMAHKATRRTIGGWDGHLANLRPFRNHAGTFSARWEDGRYCVYSYRTMIASAVYVPTEWALVGNTIQWITDRRYSHTTACHLGMVGAWLARRVDEKSVTVADVLATWPVRVVQV